jgi:tetratricopeptide (TPR) repeat protein
VTRSAIAVLCLFTIPAHAAKRGNQGEADRVYQVREGPGPKSKAEVAAVEALLKAQNQPADDRIRAAEALMTKFPKTDFKSFALYIEADAWEEKGDHAKAIVYSEQSLAADSHNFEAEILMANVIAGQTRDTDLDKPEKLANARRFAQESLDMIPGAAKPVLFHVTDDAWAEQKDEAESRAWQALGLAAMVEKKPEEAIADYEKGLARSPDPVLMVRTARALEAAKKYDAAIDWLDKAIASPKASPQIKDVAAKDKARITAEKARR